MTRLISRLLILSVIGVLLLPGNERHRDQVVRSLSAAYAHAGDFCSQNRDTCDRVVGHLRNTSVVVVRELGELIQAVATDRPPERSRTLNASF